MADLVAQFTGGREVEPGMTLDELGLSSLERVELMVAIEDAFQTHLDEGAFSNVRDVGQLRQLVEQAAAEHEPAAEPVDFPTWNRSISVLSKTLPASPLSP